MYGMTYFRLRDLQLCPSLQVAAVLMLAQKDCCPGMLVYPEVAPLTDQRLHIHSGKSAH